MNSFRLMQRLASVFLMASLICVSPWLHAQSSEWPNKPIRLVLPSAPGGGADVFGRQLAPFLAQELKTQVVIDNKPGATGQLAHEAVVRQPADGYNLVISYSAAIIGNKLLLPKMSHDPLTDLQPIGRIGGGGGNVLIVNNTLPVNNIKELIDYVKQKGEQNYASWGVASGGHLVMEMMKKRTGMALNHVPYKSGPQISADVISGVMPIAWIDSASAVQALRSGKVRAIAVSAQKRLPQNPTVATLTEQGIQFDVTTWYGLFGPNGLPPAVLNRLNAALNKWLVLPEAIQFIERMQNGPGPIPTTPDEFAKVIQRDLIAWKALIAESGVTP